MPDVEEDLEHFLPGASVAHLDDGLHHVAGELVGGEPEAVLLDERHDLPAALVVLLDDVLQHVVAVLVEGELPGGPDDGLHEPVLELGGLGHEGLDDLDGLEELLHDAAPVLVVGEADDAGEDGLDHLEEEDLPGGRAQEDAVDLVAQLLLAHEGGVGGLLDGLLHDVVAVLVADHLVDGEEELLEDEEGGVEVLDGLLHDAAPVHVEGHAQHLPLEQPLVEELVRDLLLEELLDDVVAELVARQLVEVRGHAAQEPHPLLLVQLQLLEVVRELRVLLHRAEVLAHALQLLLQKSGPVLVLRELHA